MNNISIGTDIEEVSRFQNKSEEFLNRIFTENEIKYSTSSKNYAQHLCARFCAKEAIIKALDDFGIDDIFLKDVEITNKESGAPFAKIEKYPDIKIKISLSHTKNYATASVILIK